MAQQDTTSQSNLRVTKEQAHLVRTLQKNCELETITTAELLASKFLFVIGNSTGDYDLKKKIRKSDMSIDAITEALHEYMYEKLNDSPETEEEKKIRYLNKRKTQSTKDLSEKPTKLKKTVIDAEHQIGPDNTNVRPGEKNAQNAKRLDTMQNIAEQTKK